MSGENGRIEKLKKTAAIVKFILLVVIVAGVPLYLILFQKDMLAEFKSFDGAVAFLRDHSSASALVYIGLQVLQIVISVLPGQFFQFAAGYLYGFLPGLLLSVAGAALGTTVTYTLARVLGSDLVHMVAGKEKGEYWLERFNSKRAYIIVFILYLVPGFPKDTLGYVAGASEMRYPIFLIISLVGRLPAMAASIVFGSMYMKENYAGMWAVGIAAVGIFLLCVIFRKRLNSAVDAIYNKLEQK